MINEKATKINLTLLIAIHKDTLKFQLQKSLISIQNQKHIPKEIIIIIDGPIKNELKNYIKNIQTKFQNITIINNIKNSGLAYSLNKGISQAKYELIARLDPDDEIINDRFFHQKKKFDKNSRLSICGSNTIECFNGSCRLIKKPLNNYKIYRSLKYKNPIIHSSVMFKKSDIIKVGKYPLINKCQDYLLWIKCMQAQMIFENIKIPLLRTKLDIEMMKRRDFEYFKFEYQIYLYMFKNKIISSFFFLMIVLLRVIIRVMPNPIKIFFYNYR